MLERYFHLSENRTTLATEIRAGVATFLTMAYILFVNPQVLSQAGMPVNDVFIATAVGSALATFIMGIYANYPFALAPGMGLNAYFTYGVVLGMGVSYQVALTAVFLEGVLFAALALGGIRTHIVNAIPYSLKVAIMSGIGLFLAIIGFEQAGIVVGSEATLVTLGDLTNPKALLSLGGLALIAALMSRRVMGSILIGILVTTVAAWATGLAPLPAGLFSLPQAPRETWLAFDFNLKSMVELAAVTLTFFFVDFFDTAGTLIGVGRLGGLLNEKGELPRADRAFTADAVGTIGGAMLGTSAVTSYVESATGIEEGGRTGLTAVVVAGFFLLALFFAPIFTAVPALATAPALIIVGALMMRGAKDVPWEEYDEAIPAFLTIAAMPFTYSIANGIVFGMVSWAAIKVFTGRFREVSPTMYGIVALLIAFYAFVK